MRKDVGDEIDEIIDLDGDHVGFSVVFPGGFSRVLVGANRAPGTGFADRLDRHFERKIADMSTAQGNIAE